MAASAHDETSGRWRGLSTKVFAPLSSDDCDASCEDDITEECGSPLYPGHKYDKNGDKGWLDDGSMNHCYGAQSCAGHGHDDNCNPTEEDAVDVLASVLPTLKSGEIQGILRRNPDRLRLNVRRSALQMLGCGGLVDMSLELTPEQVLLVAGGGAES